MATSSLLSISYAFMCLGVIGFQLALIAGAPWGRLTQGGQREGALPVSGRIAAGISAIVLTAMASAISSSAGFWPNWPTWTGWAALGLQSVITLLNWITRSKSERYLWAPVTSVMLTIAALVVLAS